jgi:hypothetical protein
MCRIENQTLACLIFDARRGYAPRRSELKKSMEGLFQQPLNKKAGRGPGSCRTQV